MNHTTPSIQHYFSFKHEARNLILFRGGSPNGEAPKIWNFLQKKTILQGTCLHLIVYE